MKKIVTKPESSWRMSSYVIHQDTVYFGHQGGIYDSDGNLLDSVEKQTRQCFLNIEMKLKEINLTLSDLAKVTVILKNIVDFEKMHSVWRNVFSDDYPVRTTITSDFVDEECLIQIDGIACFNSE